jgi:hypothetical protein
MGINEHLDQESLISQTSKRQNFEDFFFNLLYRVVRVVGRFAS